MPNEDVRTREPSRFGKYLLLDRIAAGGIAEVFLARQEGPQGLEKTLVIKRIRPHLSSQQRFVTAFLNEAKLAAQLNHPNVVQIYDLGKVRDTYFIAMEYLFGRDMRRVIPKAEASGVPLPLVYALKIASSVCEGLFHAHQKNDLYGNPLGIVHRGIAPESLFLAFDGTVKILDFGISEAAHQAEETREVEGRHGYQSPEQCLGKPLDHRSDLFSLGAVLYEWVTGLQPFTGESKAAVLESIVEGRTGVPSSSKAEIPEAVERLLMKALEKDRELRYQSAHEMQVDIDRFLSQYEFTPSYIHLSNFLKQLFSDELEEERRRLLSGAREPPPSVAEEVDGEERPTRRPIPIRPVGPPAESDGEAPGGSEKVLTVAVDEDTYDALKQVAERNQLPVGALVRDILTSYVKYK